MATDRSRPGTEFERRDFTENALRLLGVTAPDADGRADFAKGFATRLAVFLSEQPGERFALALDRVGDLHQNCAPFVRGNGGDPLFALLRRRDRALDVLRAAARHGAD